MLVKCLIADVLELLKAHPALPAASGVQHLLEDLDCRPSLVTQTYQDFTCILDDVELVK